MFFSINDFISLFFKVQASMFSSFSSFSYFFLFLANRENLNVFYLLFFFNKNIFKTGFFLFYKKITISFLKKLNYLISFNLPSVLTYKTISKKNLLVFFKTNELII